MTTETREAQAAEAAFTVLGHETRLAILLALWELRSTDDHVPQQPVAFTDLRRHVGMRDKGQFTYHLKPLLDQFVHRTEDGYILRREGERVVSAVLAGAFTDEVVFDAEPHDHPCPLCGGDTVFECNTERTLGHFAIRCTECEGAFGGAGFDGALSLADPLLPVGTRSRDPYEFYEAQKTVVKHSIMSAIEGVCPDCTGPMSTTPRICRDHHLEPGHRCPSCDTVFEIMFDTVCDVCNLLVSAPPNRHLLTDPHVVALLEDHGYDVWRDWISIELEAVRRQTVRSEDPFELEVVLEADGERLVATLDGDGHVTDLERGAVAN